LRRIVHVEQPTELYALADGLPEGTLTSPILFKGSLVAADKSSNALIVINPETREATRATLDVEGEITAIAPGNSSIIIAFKDGSLMASSITGDATPLALGDTDAEAMTDLSLYANRLYRLDATKGQVWRYPSTSGGFGAEQAYLQAASTSLNDAVALSIDSNVYVLKQNGTVVRFFSGGDDGFTLPAIDPPLVSGNDIWTEDEAESQYIGIADASGKRVLLFTKEGRLAAQYTSPAFNGPTGLVADEATKKLYAVDGNTLYEVPLP
jgi:DNA-binding beta-propeller fold protein YncE